MINDSSLNSFAFYGHQAAAKVNAISTLYKGIQTPLDLYKALSTIWCKETCGPALQPEWTLDNKTLGQCSITAFLAQDIFGGDVYAMHTENGMHCYNVVNGQCFDLTSEQFGDKAKELVYTGNILQHREDAIHFAREEKFLRYKNLSELLAEFCNKKSL